MALFVSLFKPLAYISLPVIVLRSIAASSPTGRYRIRQGVYVGTIITVAACSIVLAAGMFVVGKRFDVNSVVARVYYAFAGKALNIDVEVEGEENMDERPAVLMMNHQTMLDVLVVGRLMPQRTSIVAKKSLRYTPLGPFMMLAGAIFLDRGDNARAVQSLVHAGETMKRFKLSLWMFPEGTRTSTEVPDVQPLKRGGFHLALQAGVPIIPIVAENYWKLYHKGLFNTGTIKVRVLPPIPTTGLTASDIPGLATRVRDQMMEAIREISSGPTNSGRTEIAEGESPRRLDSLTATGTSLDKGSSTTTEPVPVLEVNASNASLASSFSASTFSVSDLGENDGETEEDEGIILVGRPI